MGAFSDFILDLNFKLLRMQHIYQVGVVKQRNASSVCLEESKNKSWVRSDYVTAKINSA